jgi:hypothetical protein
LRRPGESRSTWARFFNISPTTMDSWMAGYDSFGRTAAVAARERGACIGPPCSSDTT